jgi:hypothetical protein
LRQGGHIGLRDPLPRSVSWITRAIGYTVGVIAIVIAWRFAGNVLLVGEMEQCNLRAPASDSNHTAMQSAKAFVACVDQRVGIVEWLAFRPTRKLFSSLPYTPCRYVGTWEASRVGSIYRVTLGGDGQFAAVPVRTSEPNATNIMGSWSVAGTIKNPKMVWLYDQGRIFPPDVNPIQNVRPDGFTLIEVDGSTTEYRRAEAASDEACDAGVAALQASSTTPATASGKDPLSDDYNSQDTLVAPPVVGAGPAPAGSLCREGEVVRFNCTILGTLRTGQRWTEDDKGKIASLCSSRDLGPTTGYLQYRYGALGAVEVEFPGTRELTQQQFRWNEASGYPELGFATGSDEHRVYYNDFTGDNADCEHPLSCPHSGVLTMARAGDRRRDRWCSTRPAGTFHALAAAVPELGSEHRKAQPQVALAQSQEVVVVTYRGAAGTTTEYIAPDRHRIVEPDGGGAITDLHRRIAIQLDAKTRLTGELSLKTLVQMQLMGQYFAKGYLGLDPQLVATGVRRTIAGHECEEHKADTRVMVFSLGLKVCASKTAPGAAQQAAFVRNLASLTAAEGIRLPSLPSGPGLLLASESSMPGTAGLPGAPKDGIERVEATSIVVRPVRADDFAVPATFSRAADVTTAMRRCTSPSGEITQQFRACPSGSKEALVDPENPSWPLVATVPNPDEGYKAEIFMNLAAIEQTDGLARVAVKEAWVLTSIPLGGDRQLGESVIQQGSIYYDCLRRQVTRHLDSRALSDPRAGMTRYKDSKTYGRPEVAAAVCGGAQ